MSSRLENLTQHIFSHSGVQSSHIQRAFVRFGSGATRDIARATAGGRHGGHGPPRHYTVAHGRADGSWDGIRVLRDDNGGERRRHVLLLLCARVPSIVARCASRGMGRGQISPRVSRVGHGVEEMRTESVSQISADSK